MSLHSETKAARLVQINVSPQGGVPKHPIAQALLTINGVQGDKQGDRRFHGGPQRAVCLYSLELIEALQDEGHPIAPGTTGENLTISGLDWSHLAKGSRLRIGPQVQLEITDRTVPCFKIAASFEDGQFKRILHKLYPGWSRLYARVLREGTVQPGDEVFLESESDTPGAS